MEFWGVEVKAGQKLKVVPELGKLIHISQAAIGEVKDAKVPKNIPLRMKTGEQDFIIGSLSAEDRPQLMFDLVFEKEFELSHDLKKGSVFYMGYIADDVISDDEGFSDEDSEESSDEDVPNLLPIEAKENGTVKPKADDVKPAAAKAKKEVVKVEVKEEKKVATKNDEDDSDDDDEDDTEFSSDEENALAQFASGDSDISGDDSDEEDDSSDEEIPVELPKGKQNNKKRQAESAEKTPAAKKAKQATPEKSGKKGQNSTPAPVKSAGKTPNMQKQQTPKSGGQPSGKSFDKNFSSGKNKQGRK